MSSFPARYFPGLLAKRSWSDAQDSSSVDSLAADDGAGRMGEDCSHETLLLRLQKKDVDALGLLYRIYARLVYSVCFRILRDPTEAEDLVHEVFLCLYRKCQSFDPRKGTARSWIIQLAYSKCFDWRDYLMARHRLHETNKESHSPSCKSISQMEDPDPAYLVLWNRRMVKAFKSLSKEQQESLELFYFHGYTFKEIASKLGYSYGNAKHHVYRGIERLRVIVFDGLDRRSISRASQGVGCELKEKAG